MATLEEARAAKEHAKLMLADVGGIHGIGIARLADGFGVKVNLARLLDEAIPDDLDGVPIVLEVVGQIRPQHLDAAIEEVTSRPGETSTELTAEGGGTAGAAEPDPIMDESLSGP